MSICNKTSRTERLVFFFTLQMRMCEINLWDYGTVFPHPSYARSKDLLASKLSPNFDRDEDLRRESGQLHL